MALDAGGPQHRDRAVQHRLRARVRLRGRLEPRNRALEEQQAAGGVLERELHERAHERLHCSTRASWQLQRLESLEQPAVAVGEHRVEQRVLRIEVGVERRLAHADLAGERMERDTADAVGAGQLPGGFDDRCQLGVPSFCDFTYH